MSTPISLSILTPTGYQKFDGIRKTTHSKCVKLTTDKTELKSSLFHRYIVNGEEVYAKDIQVGHTIGTHIVQSITFIDEQIDLYDPLNVQNGKVYCHDNGLISHNSFVGTSNSLIEADALFGLKAQEPQKIMHASSLRIYEEPQENHFYIMTVDVSQGRGKDYSAFSLIDVTEKPFKQVCAYNDNKISPLVFPNILVKTAKHYNNALLIIENNGPGQIVCNSVYYDYEYENTFVESSVKVGGIGVSTTRKTKRVGISTLKDLIEEKKLIIVDSDTIVELSQFEEHGSSYEAKAGGNDDLVMTLVLFAWFVSSSAFGDYSEIDIRKMIYESRIQEIEEEFNNNFGFISSEEAPETHPVYDKMIDDLENWSKL